MLLLLALASIFVLLVILETFFEANARTLARVDRWPGNILLVLISNGCMKLIIPFGLAGISMQVEKNGLGLFNLYEIPFELILSILLLDFFIWLQHLLTHKIPLLWRLHRVHHSDVDLDVTSALRFHPLEIFISAVFKAFLIFSFGFKFQAILIFEILLTSMAMFNHANLYLPPKIEKIIRLFVVTPQMHIIHHDTRREYSDSNYGFNLSLWDRIFKTYIQFQAPNSVLGQKNFREIEDQGILRLMIQPFLRS